MAKMHKLTKGGQTIYPATIYDAVVNPKTRNSLPAELSELEGQIGDFCTVYKSAYKQLDSLGNEISLGNREYRISDKIKVDRINALYYHILCNATKESAIISAYNSEDVFLPENSIISTSSDFNSYVEGVWKKSEGTSYIRISYVQRGESTCTVTSSNDRYKAEIDKKLETVKTADIKDKAITPAKLDRSYAEYEYSDTYTESNNIGVTSLIKSLKIKNDGESDLLVNVSGKNLFLAKLNTYSAVTQGISEFTVSDITGTFKEYRFAPFFLPKGNYYILARIETLAGENAPNPSIFLRNFSNIGNEATCVLSLKEATWVSKEIKLSEDTNADNCSVVFSISVGISTASTYNVKIMICRAEDINESVGDWEVSSLSQVNINARDITQISTTLGGMVWSNDGTIFSYAIGALPDMEDVAKSIDAINTELSEIKNSIALKTDEIVSWGDSLVQSSGSSTGKPTTDTNSDVSWPAVLGRLTGMKSVNMGVGGEASWQIGIRQGGFSLLGKLDKIPATTEEIDIELTGQEQNSVRLQNNWEYTTDNYLKLPNVSAKGVNPVTIHGVEGNLKQYTRYRLTISSSAHTDGTLKIAVGYSDANLTEGYVHEIGVTTNMTAQNIADAIAELSITNWVITVDGSTANSVLFAYENSDNNNGLKIEDAGTTGVEADIVSIGRYTFSRIEEGEEIELPFAVNVMTYGAKTYKKHISVFWCGANDAPNIDGLYKNQPSWYKRVKRMIDVLDYPKKYIVINHLQNGLKSDEEIVQEFGSHYINISRWIAKYGLDYVNYMGANITPSDDDNDKISKLTIPSCFKIDGIHLNYWGYQCVARAVYECGLSLGYW